jgi:hypothetical protein
MKTKKEKKTEAKKEKEANKANEELILRPFVCFVCFC